MTYALPPCVWGNQHCESRVSDSNLLGDWVGFWINSTGQSLGESWAQFIIIFLHPNQLDSSPGYFQHVPRAGPRKTFQIRKMPQGKNFPIETISQHSGERIIDPKGLSLQNSKYKRKLGPGLSSTALHTSDPGLISDTDATISDLWADQE